MSNKITGLTAAPKTATQSATRHPEPHTAAAQHSGDTGRTNRTRHAKPGLRTQEDNANPIGMQSGLSGLLPGIDFSRQDNSTPSHDAASSDFARLIDTRQPLNLDLLHGDIQQAGDAQLDQWCRQLSAGTWPSGESVSVELPLPGLGRVDVALESDAARVHMVVDAGSNEAARKWFSAQRGQEIKAKLQHYTGKTVNLDFASASPSSLL